MADSDSDSSSSHNDSHYTKTNVVLGYAAEEPTDDPFNQLGGYPKWFDPSSLPPASFAKCKVCSSPMSLFLQLNGDLPDFPSHERRLYIFGCRRKACRRKEGCIRAFRCTRHNQMDNAENKKINATGEKNKGMKTDIGETLFGATKSNMSPNTNANPFTFPPANNSNPFSTSTSNPPNPFSTSITSTTSPFAALTSKPPQNPSPSPSLTETFARKAHVSTPPPASPPSEPWPPTSDFPTPYPLYHLDAENETLDSSPSVPSNATILPLAEEASSSSAITKESEKEDQDAFESSLDKTFLRFSDRLNQNPEQVLRYEFGGTPLLYSHTDEVGKIFAPSPSHGSNAHITTKPSPSAKIPRCYNCGHSRTFELQLTPQAIVELEAEEEVDWDEGMEWETVIVGVCKDDCFERGGRNGEVAWLEEWVGVQWEERVKR
ncbi:MAG: hypothetical protein M1834_001403 [Cirrosporium novae-zelandiae]|nr:MAG: hypothetical protein M1834_001403 [Cirrosporium novae-zelandiae]